MARKAVSLIAGVLFLFAGAVNLAADERSLAEVLQARLDHVYGPIWESGDAAKFVAEFLTDDAVITASDSPTVWSGIEQSTKLIADLMAAYPKITAKSVWSAPVGTEGAYQFVQLLLVPAADGAEPETAKSLYVWLKTPKGWRVAADHYSYVGMDAPTGLK